MASADVFRLLFLSAIWGASFLFLRISAPAFGPMALILVRTLVAALCLTPLLFGRAERAAFRRHWAELLVVGVFSAGLPFSLFAYAMLSLEAGFGSLLNATTPLFTALLGALWFAAPLRRGQQLGLVIGFTGVGVLAWDRLSFRPGGSGWAVAAALTAAVAYGLATQYTKKHLADVPSRALSAGTLWGAALPLVPLGLWFWPATPPPAAAWLSAVALAAVCTAYAFLLFYDLLSRTGATVASTVTYIVPVFAILWGRLFLGEVLTWRMAAGMAITLLGTAFVTEVFTRRRP